MKLEKNKVRVRFKLNGEDVDMEVGAGETALEVLRDRCGLKGPKEGCGIGECGACTIVADGKAVNACLMLGPRLDGCVVQTVEGISKPDDRLSPLQQAFLDHHAVQCGFCTPGLLMSAQALFGENSHPARRDIVRAISGNLCRCTGYGHIVEAIEDAAQRMSKEGT